MVNSRSELSRNFNTLRETGERLVHFLHAKYGYLPYYLLMLTGDFWLFIIISLCSSIDQA